MIQRRDDAVALAAPPAGKLRRWLPTLAGLGLALLGLGALGAAGSGLRLTVGPVQAPSLEADPLALLRDDVAALQGDVGALGPGLEGLAQALDGAAAARDEALVARLEALDRGLQQALDRQRGLETRLEALAGPGARAALVTAEPPPAEPPPAEPPPAEPPPAEPPPAEPPPAEPPSPVAAPAPPRPAPGGLFALRTSGPAFDERLRFQVLGALSRVGFDGKSTLHDYTGATSEVEGWLEARLADPSDGRAEVVVRAATLRTGVDGRDEEMRRLLDTERFPELRFVMNGFRGAQVDRDARTLRGELTGDVTIHGVTRPVVVPVRASLDAARRLVVEGEVLLNMSDHGVQAPDLGVIVVEDQVRLWLSLRLRALGRAEADVGARRLALAAALLLGGCYGDMVVAAGDRAVQVVAPTYAWRPARPQDLVGFWESIEVTGSSAGAVLRAYALFGADGDYSAAALVVDEEGRSRFAVLADGARWTLAAGGLDLGDGSPPLGADAAGDHLRLASPEATMVFARAPLE